MKASLTASRKTLMVLPLILASMVITNVLSAQDWYHTDWPYRCAVSIDGLADPEAEFQVKIALTATFDFSHTLEDGSDIRITAADGTTELPFWIEEWNRTGATGTIWVKVPLLPTDGLSVFLYYGNPSPVILINGELGETPPAGPFTKAAGNPIVPIGGPPSTTNLLAENIVYDDETNHYWMVLTNQSSGPRLALVYSDTPTDPDSWHWSGYVDVGLAIAPHLMKHEDTWYIFYGDRAHPSSTNPLGWPIAVASSSSVAGPYTYLQEVLATGPAGSWESYRVDEPTVIQHNDGHWILMYMAERGSTDEQVGYATADNLLGPYTKYAGNPCIPFGPVGSYDGGTVADPWVYEYHGVYYIGYTVSPTSSSPWQTALATTTNWTTFTKHGIILPSGSEFNSFRGAVTRIGDEYVFSYTGGPAQGQYRMCIATQPVHQYPSSEVNDGDAVFDFFDGFDEGNIFNSAKWSITNGNISHLTVDQGILTMRVANNTYVRIDGALPFGTGYVSESRAQHPDQGTQNRIMELGFAGPGFTNTLRMVDDFPSITHWQRQATSAGTSVGIIPMAQTSNKNWNTFHVYRNTTGSAGFQVNNTAVETVTQNVPSVAMPPFLMSYTNSSSSNTVYVDWTRVRKWRGTDPLATVSAEVFNGNQWLGGATGEQTEWHNTANWSSSAIPGPSDFVYVPRNLTNNPRISAPAECRNLLVDQSASLVLSPSGELTVNGSLRNNGTMSILSTSVNNGGSLIVRDTAFGNVTYTRFLRPQNNSGNRHFFSSPVGGLTIPVFLAANANLTQIWEWDELTASWPTVTSGTFISGKGYNLEQTSSSTGSYVFTGAVVNSAVIEATSPYLSTHTERNDAYDYGLENDEEIWSGERTWTNYGGGGWNLMGNPFTSALDAEEFITVNYTKFDPNYLALYIYDGEAEPDVYRWAGINIPDFTGSGTIGSELQTGQGFFVLALYNGAVFEFNADMQIHGSSTVKLWKSAKIDEPWPGLELKMKYGDEERSTCVVYNADMTPGLDPGYDLGQLSNNPGMEIYTTLAEKDNSVNFARQALPIAGAGEITIPVGIDTESGGEVTFSATTVPLGTNKFWLEDRTKGTFTDLSANSYTTTVPAKTYGTGRFFILASANTPTGTETVLTGQDLRIWSSNGKLIIRGEVKGTASCEIYDIQGKKLLAAELAEGDFNSVVVPSQLHGVFIVRVIDGGATTIRRVVIL